MSFFETPRFPEEISYGAQGGPEYSTDVIVLNSGYEQRNANWSIGRCAYDVSHGVKTKADIDALVAFFRVCKGRTHGFRFKDWLDYQVTVSNGLLGAGIGSGSLTYQINKVYTSGSTTETRAITKPVSGTITVYRGGSPVTIGAAPGNCSVSTTNGTVTFVADASSAASAVTVGTTTSVTLAANPGTLIAGQSLYLSGFSGADAAFLNGIAHTINSVSGAGPYVFVLATNTTGKTITVGSGTGYKYPQSSEALTVACEFDVPCRFDIDRMQVAITDFEVYDWQSIPVLEIRV
jgi:uncharacterized protein (TIGR02217 family)